MKLRGMSGDKAQVIVCLGTLAAILWTIACATTQQRLEPVSRWQGGYHFSWQPPRSAGPGALRVTIAVVSPAFAQQNEFALNHASVANGFTRSLASDLDSLLIAKGMTVTGPYESLDMMTYPDKKNADLSLTPDVVLNATVKESGWVFDGQYFTKPVQVFMDGSVSLVLREPLSGEKIWIRKIPLQTVSKSGTVIARRQTLVTSGPPLIQPGAKKVCLSQVVEAASRTSLQPGDILLDGIEEALADCIQEVYNLN